MNSIIKTKIYSIDCNIYKINSRKKKKELEFASKFY